MIHTTSEKSMNVGATLVFAGAGMIRIGYFVTASVDGAVVALGVWTTKDD
jgi:hypothetical protein